VLEGSEVYQPTGQPIEVYQGSGQNVEASYADAGNDNVWIRMTPDLGDFGLRPAGGSYEGWEGSRISGSWVA
jgi:hypothetical protein